MLLITEAKQGLHFTTQEQSWVYRVDVHNVKRLIVNKKIEQRNNQAAVKIQTMFRRFKGRMMI